MNFHDAMNSPAYDFLRTNPRLGNRIIMLGLAGSYAYGTLMAKHTEKSILMM